MGTPHSERTILHHLPHNRTLRSKPSQKLLTSNIDSLVIPVQHYNVIIQANPLQQTYNQGTEDLY